MKHKKVMVSDLYFIMPSRQRLPAMQLEKVTIHGNVGSNAIDARDNGTAFETAAAGTIATGTLARLEEVNESNH